MTVKAFTFFALFAIPLPVQAQPYSTSMAQCAGLYDALTRLMTSVDKQESLAVAASRYLGSARAQAMREGRNDPEKAVEATYSSTRDEWIAKGARIVFSQESHDWAAYCRSFAQDQGIDLGLS
ncbi:MAG: hypothetical protein HOY44_03835 [Maritimibacter sp.]|uniref:hypothetical protein n=1 Tax=Maritimibacter sp. TaxID=2003363 RepID=UPI001D6C752E|nr:hypothetical protein [Maritimibacter sp.]MBL6426634.1 hypothetical protein [Maritimibacter sp.]